MLTPKKPTIDLPVFALDEATTWEDFVRGRDAVRAFNKSLRKMTGGSK